MILPVLVLGVLYSFNTAISALTAEECSLLEKNCLCIAFPGARGTICTPIQNVGDNLRIKDKQ